jgi:hypothetical protein
MPAALGAGGSQAYGGGIWLNPEGTKLMVCTYNATTDRIRAYDLSTPFMISTATFWYEEPMPVALTASVSCWFSSNGLVAITQARDKAVSSLLSTPYLISSSYSNTTITLGNNNTHGAGFNEDGTIFWQYERSSDNIYHYICSTPYNLDNAAFESSKSKTGWQADTISSTANSYGIRVSSDGLRVTMHGMNADDFIVWQMSVPYDFSTLQNPSVITYGGVTFPSYIPGHDTFTGGGSMMGLYLSNDYIYLFDHYDGAYLRQFTYTP